MLEMRKLRKCAYALSINKPVSNARVVLHFLSLPQSLPGAQYRLQKLKSGWKLVEPWSDRSGRGHDGFVYYSVSERVVKKLCGEGLVTARRTLYWGWILTSKNELVLTNAGREMTETRCGSAAHTLAA